MPESEGAEVAKFLQDVYSKKQRILERSENGTLFKYILNNFIGVYYRER